MWIDGGPNPLFKLVRPDPRTATAQEAAEMARVVSFPARIVLAGNGGDLVAKGVEKALVPVFKRTPIGLLDALAVAVGVHSVTLIIFGAHYGYITSIWRFIASLIAHFI